MAELIAGFVKVSTPEGASLYLNPHHVTAIEAGSKCIVRLHDGDKVTVAEDSEELVRMLGPHLPGASSRSRRAERVRQRMRRRGS